MLRTEDDVPATREEVARLLARRLRVLAACAAIGDGVKITMPAAVARDMAAVLDPPRRMPAPRRPRPRAPAGSPGLHAVLFAAGACAGLAAALLLGGA